MLLLKFVGLGDEGAGGAEGPVEGADGDAVDFHSIVSICDKEAFKSSHNWPPIGWTLSQGDSSEWKAPVGQDIQSSHFGHFYSWTYFSQPETVFHE